MVNTNIQSGIPLSGRGYIVKPTEGYEPGEYSEFCNLVQVPEGIRSRSNITAMTSRVIQSPRLVGNLGYYAVFAGPSAQMAVQPQAAAVLLWDPAILVTPGIVPPNWRTHVIVWCGMFNNEQYWLTMETDYVNIGPVITYKFNLRKMGSKYNVATPPTNATPPVVATNFISVQEFYTNDKDFFIKAFVFRDRLWIATREALYFSKALDFTVWNTPDGGFFRFESEEIRDFVAFKDQIFVLCASGVYKLTYSSDPNSDGSVVAISTVEGGLSLAVSEDVVYMSTLYSLYRVDSFNSKLMDYDVAIKSEYGFQTNDAWKANNASIVVFNGEVYLTFYRLVGANGVFVKRFHNYVSVTYPYNEHLRGYNTFAVNLTTGAVRVIDFHDNINMANPNPIVNNYHSWGHVVDMAVFPEEYSKGTFLFMLTTASENLSGSVVAGTVYYTSGMEEDYSADIPIQRYTNLTFNAGTAYAPNSSTSWLYIPIVFEVNSFVPDGNEYLMKRFRTLVLEALVPKATVNLVKGYWAMNNLPLPGSAKFTLNSSGLDGSTPRSPYAFKYGIKQRGKALTLKLTSKVAPAAIVNAPSKAGDTPFFLRDLRLYWGYTGRSNKEQAE